jgi:excisionase family DNA binding protein
MEQEAMPAPQQELSQKALTLKQKALTLKQQTQGGSWRGRETISVEEAAIILDIARNSAYAAVHNGQLPGVWIGKRFLVSVPRLRRMLDGEATA